MRRLKPPFLHDIDVQVSFCKDTKKTNTRWRRHLSVNAPIGHPSPCNMFSTNPKFAERACCLNSADSQCITDCRRALRGIFAAGSAAHQRKVLIINDVRSSNARREFRVQRLEGNSGSLRPFPPSSHKTTKRRPERWISFAVNQVKQSTYRSATSFQNKLHGTGSLVLWRKSRTIIPNLSLRKFLKEGF